MTVIDAHDHEHLFVPHGFDEQLVDLGEVRLNYATAGDPDGPAILLIPGQSESWWGYEEAMRLLAEKYQVFAVDLRGQGRSTWTPGRYSLDTFGGDLVRFLDLVVEGPAYVAGLSSGGVLATWLAAYAKPGQILGAVLEDPPLFASETNPAVGHSIRQGLGPVFAVWHRYLGAQWGVGDVAGMGAAMGRDVPPELLRSLPRMLGAVPDPDAGVPQNLKEYDPEWGGAFVTGTAAQNCDHLTMLQQVKVPVLFTHHFHEVDATTGRLLGASSDLPAATVRRTVEAAGQPIEYRTFPDMPHSMHGADPQGYATLIDEWIGATAPAAGVSP